MRPIAYVLPLVLLAAAGCKQDHSGDPAAKAQPGTTESARPSGSGADAMASHDSGAGNAAQGDAADAE